MKLILKISVVLIMIPVAVGFGFAWRRYCPPVSGVQVLVNGVQSAGSANRCPNRMIVVSVAGNLNVLVDRENQQAFVPGQEFYKGFGLVFSRGLNPLGVSLNDRVKIERDTELRFVDNGLSYKDIMSGDEIQIKFEESQ